MSDPQSQAPSTPYARSSVNGMIIPLLPHQGGILHRFAQPENRLVIASTSEPAAEAERLVSEATPDPMLQQALEENQQLREQAAANADALAKLQEQMAELLAARQADPVLPAPPAVAEIPQAAPVPKAKAKATQPVLPDATPPTGVAPITPPVL